MSHWKEVSHSTYGYGYGYGQMPTKQEIRRMKLRVWLRRSIIGLAGLAVIGVILAVVFHKQLAREYRQRLSEHNLERARAAMRAADWNAAQRHSRSVLTIRPQDAEAGRIRFTALGKTNHQHHLQSAYWLFINPDDNESLLPEALVVALEQGPQSLFLRAFASMPGEMRVSDPVRTLMARFFNDRGEHGAALNMIRHPEADGPPSAAMRVEECRALIGLRLPEAPAESRAILAALIDDAPPPAPEATAAPGPSRRTVGDDDPAELATAAADAVKGEDDARRARDKAAAAALDVLKILAWVPGGLVPSDDEPPLPDLSQWIAAHPQASVEHRLLALHQSMQQSPDDAETIVRRATKDHAGSDAAAVGEWLLAHGQHDDAILMLLSPATTDPKAWVALISNLLKTRDLERARSVLENPPPGHDTVVAACLDALLQNALGNDRAERVAWRNALDAARLSPDENRFIEVARYATTLGAELAAIEAWTSAVRHTRGPIPLYRDLEIVVAALVRNGRTQDIHDITRIMAVFEPENLALRNNSLYLALLFDSMPPRDAEQEIEKLIEEYPDWPEIRSTHAFAALTAGRPDEALERIQPVADSPRISGPLRLALTATAHLLADRTDVAAPLLAEVPWAQLLPKERESFFRMLATKSAENLPIPDISIFGQPTPTLAESLAEEDEFDLDLTPPVRPQTIHCAEFNQRMSQRMNQPMINNLRLGTNNALKFLHDY